MKNEKGFTLIEMMIVLLVITVLLFISIPNIASHSKEIHSKGCKAFVQMVQSQVEAFRLNHNRLPNDISELVQEGYLRQNETSCPNSEFNLQIDSDGKVTLIDPA
ncbi:competence type IV pilus major pilin ComGC [Aeribacillus pallidus]|uniref:competence type IV pilus major pilin ComGC n=1 Tax=Aeribacillus pallidus TaxID=33936 RepID=UPI003D1E4A0E